MEGSEFMVKEAGMSASQVPSKRRLHLIEDSMGSMTNVCMRSLIDKITNAKP
jgi:hypothetical protein